MLVSAFGLVAIVLAVLGSYTLIAATVAQRSREIGIRMAIGARQADVARMVVVSATRLVVAGIVVGVPLTLAGSRALRSQLYGIAPTDAGTYAVTALALALAALLSAALPARRATRIQPARTLREE
jgi:ABC-type antimicrobial peptide transport system permease subunit